MGQVSIPPLDDCFHALGFDTRVEAEPYAREEGDVIKKCRKCKQFHIHNTTGLQRLRVVK